MKDLVISETARYEQMNDVVTLHLEGRNPSYIAKELGIKRADILVYIEDFKKIAKDDGLLRARAQEVVHEFDQQHNRIITELWRVIAESEDKGDLKTRSTSLKAMSDISAKRVEVLQKSGLLSDAAMGDQIVEQEERNQQVLEIVRDVSGKCNHCKFEVARRLTRLNGTVEPVPVDSDRV